MNVDDLLFVFVAIMPLTFFLGFSVGALKWHRIGRHEGFCAGYRHRDRELVSERGFGQSSD